MCVQCVWCRYVVLARWGVLHVENVAASDRGTYQCRASNDARQRLGNNAQLTVVTDSTSATAGQLISSHTHAHTGCCNGHFHVTLASRLPPSLWPPCVADADIIFLPCGFYLSVFFYSSPNLSGCRLDVYHTSTHGVAVALV